MIDLRKSHDELHFSITDSGVGIPEDELLLIFDVFYQSSRTKTGAGGSGIGLAIVKNIITGHNGTIGAMNNINAPGSCFWFKIPIYHHDVADEMANEASDEVAAIARRNPKNQDQAKALALVIDDFEPILRVGALLAQSIGFEAIRAHGGVEGLEKIKEYGTKLSVILLDIMMPDINGIDILQQVKSDPELKSIPIIMYSGTSDPAVTRQCLSMGAAGYLDKTAKKEEMQKIIEKYLR